MSIKIPEKIEKLSPYIPENYFHENKNKLIKMDWNEYIGPDKSFIEEKIVQALRSQKGKPNYYADLECEALKNKISNYLKVMTLEAQTIARACGKNNLHNLEPEDLCALTVESAAMARVPLAGTNWIPGFDK